MFARLMIAGIIAGLAVGCGPKGPIPDAPAPYRPKEKKSQAAAKKKDCKPTDPSALPGAIPEAQRRKVESANLATEANTMLNKAAVSKVKKRETLIDEAVDKLNTALAADPYNVEATYTLAGVQAMIGRTQCTVNLLSRLLELRKLDSYRSSVRQKLDQLEGRGAFAGRLDPKFAKVRGKRAYRDLARKFADGK